ncbi:unnamed protein product [Adineta steineri]|uniref:Methenyltetrahydrofolate cyclohydrolase n=1 Tax=Adineta steineri TaxID=433720 RepID=A0A815J8B5_9BILA|nr:unnamed protein product [Adineta steineri]CAF3617337.1 unnamed protein product [Adineta steineri]
MFCLAIKHFFKLTISPTRFLVTDTFQTASIKNNILYGKPIAERILNRCQNECKEYIEKYNHRPKLVAILVGGNESSKLYVRNKQRIAEHVGVDFHVINHLMHVTPSNLIDTIQDLNNDDSVDGIILQLPLPLHLIDKTEQFIDAIRSDKDVDGHTTLNNYSYRQSSSPFVTIPVVDAVKEMLLEIGEPLQGKDVVVIGRSKYVGTPLALMLSQSNITAKSDLISGATVTICHRHTPSTNLTWYCKNADIIISAVGRPKLVTYRMVKEGAIVIDVGISKSWTDKAVVSNKRFVGDVDFDEVKRIARWVTPVPGGVGAVTVACLISNLLKLARQRKQ